MKAEVLANKKFENRSVTFDEPQNVPKIVEDQTRMSPLPFLTKSSLFSIKQKRKLPKQANLEYEEEIAAGFINEEDISREFTIESILRPTKDSISLYNAKKRQSVKETIKDTIANNINMIDLYSRILFPSLFILFNVIYWTFYTYNRDVWIWAIFLCLLFQDQVFF